jgi:hypothetical protein
MEKNKSTQPEEQLLNLVLFMFTLTIGLLALALIILY